MNKRPGDSSGGKVNELLNTVSNMKNTLVHERKHVKQNQEKNNSNVNQMEVEAIKTQKEHSTWADTTDEYKKAIKNYEDRFK